MRVTFQESDSQKRIFVGYIALLAAVLIAAVRIVGTVHLGDSLSNGFGSSSVSFLDRIGYESRSNQLLGLFLAAAAFLLMLDSEEESRWMRAAIFLTGILGGLLMLVSVLGIADVIKGADGVLSSASSTKTEDILDRLSAIPLGFVALGLTWSVITSPGAPELDEEDAIDENPAQ